MRFGKNLEGKAVAQLDVDVGSAPHGGRYSIDLHFTLTDHGWTINPYDGRKADEYGVYEKAREAREAVNAAYVNKVSLLEE